MAEPGTRPPEIMRCEFRHSNLRGVLLHDMPDYLFCYSLAPSFACSTNTPEQSAVCDTSFCSPIVDRLFYPIRNGDGPNVTPRSEEINDGPVLFATLEMVEREVGQFSTTKPAAK